MLRALLFAVALLAAGTAHAQTAPAEPRITGIEACDAARRGCRPVPWYRIDAQKRLIWVIAQVRGTPTGPMRVHISSMAASEVWFNGVLIGRNGRPAADPADERPGLMDASFPIPPDLWRADGNEIALRMSGHLSPVRLGAPTHAFGIAPDRPAPRGAWRLAPTLVAAGALLAGCLYFLALAILERTRSSALLAALSGAALLQAGAEMWRSLLPYAYPVQAVRLVVILAAAWAFAVLLSAFAGERFLARRRWLPPALTAAAGAVAAVLPIGFDTRTGLALILGAGVSAVAAALGLRRGAPGARAALAALGGFLALLLAAPDAFLDLSLFMVMAALALALLVAEVVRLRRLATAREDELVRAATRPDSLSVAAGRGVEIVRLDHIAAIVGADDYAELRLTDGRTLLHAARLDQLEQTLPPPFLRVHRSAIANLAHARRLSARGGRWGLEMAAGEPLPVSRARLAGVRAEICKVNQ
ncbi:MAG: DNA-binding response regulator [Phenylobacterium sp.]|uniref:LytR/AlgR family response regulator transcription factor n=1 Tax=Phenylobacterium sp. TaxID=1871053 RepID=UPI0025D2E375|nr:LytTR family DNA-binding domain-containing protein [Phenylobacterium sp.]MBI1196921.1 DNA-binding response regulator [Phenylobacterium sp.]